VAYFKTLTQNLPGRTEKNHKEISISLVGPGYKVPSMKSRGSSTPQRPPLDLLPWYGTFSGYRQKDGL